MMNNILLIYNPNAGDTTFRFSIDRFFEICTDENVEVRVFRSRTPGDMGEYIRTADFSQTAAVYTGGGTGTVNEVVDALLHRGIDVPIGIIPAGTSNAFARLLGFGSDLEENFKALARREEIRVDAALANERFFVDDLELGTVTSAGSVSNEMKTTFGKMAYYMKGVASLNKIRKVRLSVESAGRRYSGTFSSLIVGNDNLAEHPGVTNGNLTLIATKDMIRGSERRYFGRGLRTIGEIDRGVLRLTGSEFRILAEDGQELPRVVVDGESEVSFPIQVKIYPNALRVFWNSGTKKEKTRETKDGSGQETPGQSADPADQQPSSTA